MARPRKRTGGRAVSEPTVDERANAIRALVAQALPGRLGDNVFVYPRATGHELKFVFEVACAIDVPTSADDATVMGVARAAAQELMNAIVDARGELICELRERLGVKELQS